MELKLFEISGEFGYACETLDQFMKFYELDAEERDDVEEADPDRELTITLESAEDALVPPTARIVRISEFEHRVTAKVRDWLKLYDEPGEVWTSYA
jgi:hypothetical protein